MTARSILDRLRDDDLRPGSIALPDGRTLRWDATGLHLEPLGGGAPVVTLGEGDIAAVQVSRGRALERPARWLGIVPRRRREVHRLHIDVRPVGARREARVRLSGRTEEPASLDGLPWFAGPTTDVALDDLLALVSSLRALGVTLADWQPDDTLDPTERERDDDDARDDEVPDTVDTVHVWWRRGALWTCASVAILGVCAVAGLVYDALSGPLHGLTPGRTWLIGLASTATLFAGLWMAFGPVRMRWSERARQLAFWHGLLTPRWLRRTLQRAEVSDLRWVEVSWLSVRQVALVLTLAGGRRELVEVRTWRPDEARALFVDLREALELSPGKGPAHLDGARRRYWRARGRRLGLMMAASVAVAVALVAVLPAASRPSVPVSGWIVRQAEPSEASWDGHWWNGLSPWYGDNARRDRFSDHARGADHAVVALAWSPDGRRLASGSASGVLVWDVDTAWPVRPALEGDHVEGLHVAPDGQSVLVLGRDDVWRWTADDGLVDDWTRRTPSVGQRQGMAWATSQGSVCWDAAREAWLGVETVLPCDRPRSDVVGWLSFVEQLDHGLLGPAEDGVAALRVDAHLRCDAHMRPVQVALSPGCGRAVAVIEVSTGSGTLVDALESRVVFYDLARGAEPSWSTRIDHHGIQPVQMRFSADGDRVALLASERVWLWGTGAVRSELVLPCPGCTALDLSPDGGRLAVGVSGRVEVIDVGALGRGADLAAARRELGVHGEGDVLSVAFSPDGQVLASGCHDETVRLWPLTL